ncbi:MAG: arylsulfatase [Verrucomicrobiales bacterium]
MKSILAAFFLTLGTGYGAEKPNIIFILADDLGFGDVHALNPASRIPTPNLDRLAKEGMCFTDAHSPSAVCTPTRYGVLTGRYCWRSRMKSGVLNGYSKPLIEPGRPTVASFLSKNGYHTACVGKWHLGLGFVQKENPGNKQDFDYSKSLADGAHTRGFDFSYIIPASLDFPPYVYIKNGRVTAAPDREQPATPFPAYLRRGPIGADFIMEDALDHLVDQATGFLASLKVPDKKPFFLYLPLSSPHKPVLPHRRFRGKTNLGPYGDFVHQTDAMVGKVLDALDSNGLTDNTLIFFTSDNGSFMYNKPGAPDHVDDRKVQAFRPGNHTANGSLRGTKADVWEAGHRVPFFARWPGTIKPGSKCEKTITHTDLFATCAALIGADLPGKAAEDSYSWLPLLENREDEFKRAPVINHSANGTFAIRDNDWKLILGNGSGGREAPRGKPFGKPYQLYDLNTDPGEKKNVAKKYPEIVRRLSSRCEAIRAAGHSR